MISGRLIALPQPCHPQQAPEQNLLARIDDACASASRNFNPGRNGL